MNRLLFLLAASGALLVSGEARAQLANHSVRFSIGYLDLKNTGSSMDWGVPIGLGYTGYIASHWEWSMDAQMMILTEPIANRQVIGAAGGPGLRYVFMEEQLRPYIGVDLDYLHIFDLPGTSNWVGMGPRVGFDYFVTDSLSLGLAGQSNLYWMLNAPLQTSVALNGSLSAWF
jgi:outer membrane protein